MAFSHKSREPESSEQQWPERNKCFWEKKKRLGQFIQILGLLEFYRLPAHRVAIFRVHSQLLLVKQHAHQSKSIVPKGCYKGDLLKVWTIINKYERGKANYVAQWPGNSLFTLHGHLELCSHRENKKRVFPCHAGVSPVAPPQYSSQEARSSTKNTVTRSLNRAYTSSDRTFLKFKNSKHKSLLVNMKRQNNHQICKDTQYSTKGYHSEKSQKMPSFL